MHMKHADDAHGPEIVPIKFILEDPESLTDGLPGEIQVKAALGESILEVALDHGINIEHACGGVCGCSTCHVYVEQGEEAFDEAEDDELDRVEEAPGLQVNSRLSCQLKVNRDVPVTIKVPAWNRNAVKEVPH